MLCYGKLWGLGHVGDLCKDGFGNWKQRPGMCSAWYNERQIARANASKIFLKRMYVLSRGDARNEGDFLPHTIPTFFRYPNFPNPNACEPN